MARCLHQFDIDDDSPQITYSPFVNLEPSQNISAGWQLLYSHSGAATGPGQVGVGTSYHRTSLDNASFVINWTGTRIDLIGSVSNALYNVSLDGMPSNYSTNPANAILASLDDLPNTHHSLSLTTIITNTSPDAYLTFDKARVTFVASSPFDNTTATSQTIPDSDIAFMGLWSYVADRAGNSVHVSNSVGDHADFTFRGSAVTVYGLTSSFSGNYTVNLDNVTTSLSALSSYNNSDTLLFYATDLSDTVHHVTLINQNNRVLALRVGGVNTTFLGNSSTSTSSSSAKSTIPAGTIAATVLAAVLFSVFAGILYYVCWVRRKSRAVNQHDSVGGERKHIADVERVVHTSPSSRDELESASLSTSKGYGFGLGLRPELSFTYRKGKLGSNSSGGSRNGTGLQAESHPMIPQQNDKQLSTHTLTQSVPHAPESEKLAPGWCNPIARIPSSFRYGSCYNEARGDTRAARGTIDHGDDDDTDVKTLISRQDETLAATLLLSPRTSEAVAIPGGPTRSKSDANTDSTKQSRTNRNSRMGDTSSFRVDLSNIFWARRCNRDSRSSGSGSTTWSKVRSRLYRRAHRDDGRQSPSTNKQESSSSSGPESVPVVMHQPSSANPPSKATPGSGTYSFLDFASSHVSLRSRSKTSPGTREAPAWSSDTSIRMVGMERSRDDMAPKPDAPSTASSGSHPSDNSGSQSAPSAPTPQTQRSLQFPFPITIPPSTHIDPPTAPSSEHVPEGHAPPSPPPSNQSPYLQVPQIAPPDLSLSSSSPTESVPFSVSEIHFRHSFSDYAGVDSQRASVASALPPHPPLPHREAGTLYAPPPPYIVQRVLGLPMSPLSSLSPSVLTRSSGSPTGALSSIGRQGVTPTRLAPLRVGSLLGPRPRPSATGSIRRAAAPQLPMQGGRGSFKNPR